MRSVIGTLSSRCRTRYSYLLLVQVTTIIAWWLIVARYILRLSKYSCCDTCCCYRCW